MPKDPTELLSASMSGDPDATNELVEIVYKELRRIAEGLMRKERDNHTLSPTALVNEAYIRLINYQEAGWKNRNHFIATAVRAMRQVLCNYANARNAISRGEGKTPERLRTTVQIPAKGEDPVFLDILDLATALDRLEKRSDRQTAIIEQFYFGGLSIDEIAENLGVSPRTVRFDLAVARAWLTMQMKKSEKEREGGEST